MAKVQLWQDFLITRPFNSPNDLVIDGPIVGRIYFTDPRYFGEESNRPAIRWSLPY